MAERFSIAQVTPYGWEAGHEVNLFVERTAGELARRGHRVVVLAPSDSPAWVRDSRRLIRQGEGGILPAPGEEPRVLAVGDVLPVGSARRGARRLGVDVARTIEEALGAAPFDFVHVHEPFAPSASSAALRHSRSLNVGSFHAPTERAVSTQLARRVVELFFGRLDARLAHYAATAELLSQFFPAEYRLVTPGADPPAADGDAPEGGRARIAFAHREERPALRLFLRALRRLPLDAEWSATLWTAPDAPGLAPIRREVRERLQVRGGVRGAADVSFRAGDVAVFASTGVIPAPGLLLRAIAAGAVPVASRLPVYEEILGDGELGLLFEPGDVETLSAQLSRLVGDLELRDRLRMRAGELRARLTWSRVADELEDVYGQLAARRHTPDGDAGLRARLGKRPLIDVDLHMHTDHSHDCATPVEVLLSTARERGLGAIAVTDHNEISGALDAAAKADGVKVIVAEEVKTAHQGEVIGLFLREKIPRGLSLEETIAEIKRQGGLVYVPHPFDRLHAVPDYEHLLPVLGDVDAIEVFNPRIAFKPFNEEAVRFAAKYRIVAGAGSDSHVAAGLGSVRIRMRDFDGPDEFLESLRDADIIRKPTSLLYVQALKFLETRATPAPARRARRARRVRRAARKS
ncbi:MAG: PHP domain-containing protein [Actinobacteria bacterium]|nr:MAG: PHP domain-containing protein [Actinomycetota bacterium]